jgi:hydroxypyruvate isomerase
VEIVLCNTPPGDWATGGRGFAALSERRSEFSESLRRALGYAATLGVKRLHLMAGNAPSDDAGARARYLEALREASDAAGERGIDILIEPLNRREMPGYFLNDFGRAAAIIAELGRPNIKLQFDIYHRQILHGDVARGLTDLLPTIGHVQVASVPFRHEPGSGELDDFHIFRLLDGLGYLGAVGCEYRPRAGTLAGLGWLRAARDKTNYRDRRL